MTKNLFYSQTELMQMKCNLAVFDHEATLVFPPELLDTIGEKFLFKRKRNFSPSRKEQLLEIGRGTRF